MIDTRHWSQVKLETYPGASPPQLFDCLVWCQQNIGNFQTSNVSVNDGWYYHGGGIFKFVREENAMWFALRWS